MPTFAEFKPSSTLGTLWGGGITLLCSALGAALIYKALQMDVRLVQLFPFMGGFVFLCLGIVYAYWTYGCKSLSYVVSVHLIFDLVLFLALVHAHNRDWLPVFLY